MPEEKEVEIKVKVPEGLIDYCNRKGIDIQLLTENAIRKYLFDRIYSEITS